MHRNDACTMDIYTKLEKLNLDPSRQKYIKLYLLDCCEGFLKFRSSGKLEKNLDIARKFIEGSATNEEIHRAVWSMEAEAFGAECYSSKERYSVHKVDESIRKDLVKIRLSLRLANLESRKYLVDLAYFIDSVFSYVEHSSNIGLLKNKSKFMCSKLFNKYFGD